MKRKLLLLLTLLLPMLACAYDAYIDGIYYNFLGDEAEVTFLYSNSSSNRSAYSGAVVIPTSVTYGGKTYIVTTIGDYAFRYCASMISIKIPPSLTRIKRGAFYGCTSLSKVIVSDIAAWCGIIYDGNSYTNGDFPLNNAQHLYCNENTELTEIVIPEGVTRIEALAFRDAKSVTSLIIPSSVTYIGREAFRGMHSLTSISIPPGVTSIEPYTFQDCQSLISINIPNGVTSIGEHAFRKCYFLTQIIIPNGVTNIGNSAFQDCTKLTTITNVDSGETPPVVGIDVTCAEAVQLTQDLPDGGTSTGIYAVTGYITDTDGTVSTKNGLRQQSFWMADTKDGGKVFEAYWANVPVGVEKFTVGMKVALTGKLMKYVNNSGQVTPEIKNGNVVVLEQGDGGDDGGDTPGPGGDEVTDLVNGGFEEWVSDSEPLGWKSASTASNATLSKSTEAHGGSYACLVAAPGDANKRLATQEMTLEAGTYIFSFYAKSTTADVCQTRGGYVPVKDDGSVGSYKYGDFVNINNNEWTLISYEFTLTGTTKLCLLVMNPKNSSYSTSQDILVDDATLTAVPTNANNVGKYMPKNQNLSTLATIPESVTSIGSNAFNGCSGLTSITIPNSVTSIGSSAFTNCSNLKSVTLESNAIISESRTTSTSMESIFGEQVKEYIIGDAVYVIGSNAFYNCSSLTSIKIGNNVRSIGNDAFYGCYNVQFFANRGTDGLLSVWNYGSDPYETGTSQRLSHPTISVISTTQTTITYQINNMYSDLEYNYAGESLGDDKYIVKGLRPNFKLNNPLTVLSTNNTYSPSTNATTSPISPIVISNNITASSITAQGNYIKGDAKVVSMSFIINGEEIEGVEEVKVSGLDPNKSYSIIKYKVVVKDDDGSTFPYISSNTIYTDALTLTTQQPKVINVGNVIVSAISNLDDEETNVGFEWRRTDWTDDFTSNSGIAYLYEGTMEGYIRNLYTEKLWKYRPFYESNSGNRYYGEWVGIDPTNTSYFEPTVHTYAQITVTGNRAEVKGYAMRGTDNVTSQGFLYWPTSVASARRKVNSVPASAIKVLASGNVMTATLEDLEYETQYCYVAFVTTSEGETFYGESQIFSTSVDPDGISDVKATGDVTEVARYDLQGRMIAKPQKGINIIHYSDGTSRKVLIK